MGRTPAFKARDPGTIPGGAKKHFFHKTGLRGGPDKIKAIRNTVHWLKPLVSLTDFCRAGSLSMYAENCDKSVLKRLLKQLWRIVMNCLEKSIVLPPLNEKVGVLGILEPGMIFPSRRRVSRTWMLLERMFWTLPRTLMPSWAAS